MTAARIMVFIQAAFSLLAALAFGVGAQHSAHPGAAAIIAAVNAVFGIALIVAGVKMGGCESWTRPFVIGFEVLVIIADVLSIVGGNPMALVGIVFAAVVIGLMCTAPARSCYAGR